MKPSVDTRPVNISKGCLPKISSARSPLGSLRKSIECLWKPEIGAAFDTLRSTASYGYVHLDNEFSQQPNAYHLTHYASMHAL